MTRPCNRQPRQLLPRRQALRLRIFRLDVGNDLAHMVRANQSADMGLWGHRVTDIQLCGLRESLEKKSRLSGEQRPVAFVQIFLGIKVAEHRGHVFQMGIIKMTRGDFPEPMVSITFLPGLNRARERYMNARMVYKGAPRGHRRDDIKTAGEQPL